MPLNISCGINRHISHGFSRDINRVVIPTSLT
ncbi:hypothetical protein CPS_4889 [Colwellia psychrerythraea 34H]|uniref:Uncharacterized protein n=1 Tax=Colwellia psychrerythraea (strain 34H / ATCC BAA-681) TaxID=167879 RepID=Q47UJ5_COLP3|nr:hypothetical protein CPS_4889 [Colwellia psychrerythraea 34H]